MAHRPDIETLSSRPVYANKWTRVREDQVRRKDGSEGIYGVVDRDPFVVVAALDGDTIWMVEQYRYPVQQRLWELPMGSFGPPGTDPKTMAAAELREETGFEADDFQVVGTLLPASGIMNQVGTLVVARGLHQEGLAREHEEQDMIARALPLPEVLKWVADGIIIDGPTIACLMMLQLKGHIAGPA